MRPKLTPEQLAEALRLRRRCWTQDRIATQLKVDQSTVSRSLARVDRLVYRRLEKRALLTRVKQVDQLEWLAEEAIEGWERSKQDVLTIKVTDDEAGTKTETTRKRQAGAPAFLAEARGALADVRKMLGLDAMTKPDTQPDASHIGPHTIPADHPEADCPDPDDGDYAADAPQRPLGGGPGGNGQNLRNP